MHPQISKRWTPRGAIAQLVEQRTENPCVPGSIPGGTTTERGAVELVETADNWDEEIGVLIDPDEYVEVWIGLVNEQDIMDDIFAKFLISHRAEEREYHIVWKE